MPGPAPRLVLDPEVKGQILEFIKLGAYPERAAVACGVSERSHYLWQAKGLEEREHREQGKKPRVTWQVYLDYANDIERAVAQAEMRLVSQAGDGGPTSVAALNILGLRFRERWTAKGLASTPAPKTAAAATERASVTPLDAFAARRGQRNVQAP